ncbi:arginyl-tRNA--protein transferase 1-like [Varroa destructor]|uniref:Arginyl-tRNA--protein transferase 1 n=1 Tax=Varroa destructor TaxID=109461 RepID=A0A7M7IWW4_VARDE|nr:arginyl-tRNA--protein transferase 1-like [Varroa destructor]
MNYCIRAMSGIVQYFAGEDDNGHRCGYCRGSVSNFNKGMWAYVLTPQHYQDLIDRGWRRSGKYCYKPCMKKTCCPQYTIRCDALSFKPTKSQKKVIKKMHRFLMNGRQDTGKNVGDANEAFEGSRVSGGDPKGDTDNAQFDGDYRDLEEPQMSGRGVGRINDKIKYDTEIIDSRMADRMEESKQSRPVCLSQPEINTGNMSKTPSRRGPSLKKKDLRRQKRAEKRKAGDPSTNVESSQPKNREKTLDEWLTLPHGKHKLEIRLVRTAPYSQEAKTSDEASHLVYTLYQMKVHDSTQEKCRKSDWKQFLIDSPLLPGANHLLGSFHQQYWLDGRLIAVGILDLLPSCVSSVYFYYDPEFSFLSLGTFSSLCEIKLTRDLNQTLPTLRYYYMGFYIHSCPKMRYKGRLPNSDLLCPETYTWHPIARCLPMLETSKYARFEPNKTLRDPLIPSSITQTSILYEQTGMTVTEYFKRKKVSHREHQQIKEYCELVGSKLMKELYLLRLPTD